VSLDFLGRGLRFPFRFTERSGGAQISATTSAEHAHIQESIVQILGTRPGERFMRPEFGSRLKDLVFEPNDNVLKGLVRAYVLEAIERWEKRVILTRVTFDDSPVNLDRNLLLVRIHYRVIASQVEGNLVYPFYREIETPVVRPPARVVLEEGA
jgi:phage baseplate assembly protein W